MTDENVVTKKNGVDAFGLFVDYVRLDDEGRLETQERAFLSLNMLCTYSRAKDNKRAPWEAQVFPTHEKAREALVTKMAFDAKQAVMTAEPMLVELTASDIQSIAQGDPPHSRHAGAVATERKTGKVDDAAKWDLPAGIWDEVDDVEPF